MTPGPLIRRLRRRQRISQAVLARRAGTTQAAVSRIERGLTSPTYQTLGSLLLALGYRPELEPRPLESRADPVHLAAMRRRSPGERLALGLSANRLAARLRTAGRAAG